MLQKTKMILGNTKGGISVPVLFTLIALLVMVITSFVYNPIGQEIIQIFPWHILKAIAFISVLIFASISDLKTMEVSDKYTFMLLGIGVIGVTVDSLMGAAICFVSFFVVAMLTNLGGADVKIAGACGFVLGTVPSLIALLFGLTLSLIIEFFITLVKKKPMKRHYPLVPYITIGCIAVTIMKGLTL